MAFVSLLLIFLLPSTNSTWYASDTGNLTIEIPDITEQKGTITIAIFDSEDGFPSETDKAIFKKSFTEYSESIIYTFENVPYGQYAVVVMQDRNDNGKIDRRRIIPMPKEPIGVSNMSKMARPDFSSSTIDFNEDGMEISISFLNQ
ncbi:MAG: DUF2141 domain-containing protein [Balneolales bacterium]|nr:DUF2141 domain-containing protein [Balneolales bacterium]